MRVSDLERVLETAKRGHIDRDSYLLGRIPALNERARAASASVKECKIAQNLLQREVSQSKKKLGAPESVSSFDLEPKLAAVEKE